MQFLNIKIVKTNGHRKFKTNLLQIQIYKAHYFNFFKIDEYLID